MSNDIGALLTSGGVPASPLQQGLNQYTAGEGEVQNASNFAGGMGMSTNATQGASGPLANQALQAGTQSLANTGAEASFLNQSFKNFAGGLGNILSKGASGSGGGGTQTS